MAKNRHRNRRHGDSSLATSQDNPTVGGTRGQIGISFPPDDIFKYRERRINVAQNILTGNVMYIPLRGEYDPQEGTFELYQGALSDGAGQIIPLTWLDEVQKQAYKELGWYEMPAPPFPKRCVAPADAIYAINPVKRVLLIGIRFMSSKEWRIPMASLVLVGKNGRKKALQKALELFNTEADSTLIPFYLNDGYYCKIVKELRKGIEGFLRSLGIEEAILQKTAEIIGLMFEYDNAYRYRLQDMMAEMSYMGFIDDFPKEISRLVGLLLAREPNKEGMGFKFEAIERIVKLAWLVPSMRKAFMSGIDAINFANCAWEEGELYHTANYASYNIQGKSVEERFKILEKYHGTDRKLWPPQLVIGNKPT